MSVPKPRAIHTTSATQALTRETLLAAIPEPHLAWLEGAKPGSRLVYDDERTEFGHLYPDVKHVPLNWAVIAIKGGAK